MSRGRHAATAESRSARRRAARQATEGAVAVAPDPEPPASDDVPVDRFWEHGPELEELHFEIRPPDVPGAVLRLLGRPPGWGGQDDLLDALHELYRVASASVRDAAFADLDDAPDGTADDEPADGRREADAPTPTQAESPTR